MVRLFLSSFHRWKTIAFNILTLPQRRHRGQHFHLTSRLALSNAKDTSEGKRGWVGMGSVSRGSGVAGRSMAIGMELEEGVR